MPSPEKLVTVSITMRLDEVSGETTALKNAMLALEYHLNTNPRRHKDWVEKMEIV